MDTDIQNGTEDTFKIIDIEVEERPSGEISLQAGFGTSGEIIGGGIKEKNFLGQGINLDANLELTPETVKGRFIYAKPNFRNYENTLFTSLKSSSTDLLTDSGYKTSELGFSLGTKFEQFQNIFLSPEINFLIEDLETSSKASDTLKKQEGSYTDLYFNYTINQDLRDKRYINEKDSVNVLNFNSK